MSTRTHRLSASSSGSWNTIAPRPKKGVRFSTNLTLMCAVTALISALVFVIVLALVWRGYFYAYTEQNLTELADSTATLLSEEYERTGELTAEVAKIAAQAPAISSEVGLQVTDVAGRVLYTGIWDPFGLASGTEPGLGASLTVANKSVVSSAIMSGNGETVGYVLVWAIGSNAPLNTSDQLFVNQSYGAVLLAAILATGLACLVGFVAARNIAQPIKTITSTAVQIRNGDLTARTNLKGTDELGQLAETFDDMASTIERDLKLERRVTGEVAHELRTPLMAVQATVEAMQDGVLPTDEEHLEIVASEVQHISRMLDAMLKLSRLENSHRRLDAEKVDILAVMSHIAQSQAQLFKEKGVELIFENRVRSSELFADADPELLREAVLNLLSNALRYTNEGGQVSLILEASRRDFVICVKDTGIGMAPEDIPLAFSRFWRSDVSRERDSGGLGVGLAITKEIIDLHNGTITVQSTVGEGCTFIVRIPLRHRSRSR